MSQRQPLLLPDLTRKCFATLDLAPVEGKIISALTYLGCADVDGLYDHTGLSRKTIRDTIKKLQDKTFPLHENELPKGYYKVTPNDMERWYQHLRGNHVQRLNLAAEEVQDYFKSFVDESLRPHVEEYHGRPGIHGLYDDILHTLRQYPPRERLVRCWTNLERKRALLGDDWVESYIRRRLEAGVTIHSIKKRTSEAVENAKIPDLMRKIHLVEDVEITDAEMRIYADKVGFVHLHEENPFTIILKHSAFAEQQRLMFDHHWNLLSQQHPPLG